VFICGLFSYLLHFVSLLCYLLTVPPFHIQIPLQEVFMKRMMVVLLLSLGVIAACGGKNTAGAPKEPVTYKAGQNAPEYTESESLAGRSMEAEDRKDESKPAAENRDDTALSFIFITNSGEAKERYLEYSVYLTYQSQDLAISRQELLDLIGRYGFLNTSSAAREYLDTQFSIKTDHIFAFLKEAEKIGSLQTESTTVTDHTADLVWNQRKSDRELVRIERKNRAFGQISAARKTWAEVEASLEKSEDAIDEAVQQQWSIKDNVTWAKINIHVNGPEHGKAVKVPNYLNALTALVNMLLKTAYGMIIVSPFIIIAGIIWWKRQWIIRIFKKK
jgi:hypothetical protein